MSNKRSLSIVAIMVAVLFSCTNEDNGTVLTGGGNYENPLEELELNDTTVTLFTSGEGGYAYYRIPVIVKDDDGVLYVFAEGRKNSSSDWGDIDLVMRKSEDGGTTWTDMKVIVDDAANKCGDPTPVYDRLRKRLLLCWRRGIEGKTVTDYRSANSHDGLNFYCMYSTDRAETWIEFAEFSEAIPEGLGNFDIGPVHGIQLRNGAHEGRIVIPAYGCIYEDYHSLSLYSDDGGVTWHASNIIDTYFCDENTIAEMKDGSLLMSMRVKKDEKARPYRLQCRSYDGGKSWVEIGTASLIEPMCQASLLTFTHNDELTDTLLFSNPQDESKRRNLTVSMSTDGGNAWSPYTTVNEALSAYSDMVQLTNKKVSIIYEAGAKKNYERIQFSRFTVK